MSPDPGLPRCMAPLRRQVPHERERATPTGPLPDDPLESRRPGRRAAHARGARGAGRAVLRLLVSALRPDPPQGIPGRRGAGPDPGLFRPAAGEGDRRRRRPGQGPLPLLPPGRLLVLPGGTPRSRSGLPARRGPARPLDRRPRRRGPLPRHRPQWLGRSQVIARRLGAGHAQLHGPRAGPRRDRPPRRARRRLRAGLDPGRGPLRRAGLSRPLIWRDHPQSGAGRLGRRPGAAGRLRGRRRADRAGQGLPGASRRTARGTLAPWPSGSRPISPACRTACTPPRSPAPPSRPGPRRRSSAPGPSGAPGGSRSAWRPRCWCSRPRGGAHLHLPAPAAPAGAARFAQTLAGTKALRDKARREAGDPVLWRGDARQYPQAGPRSGAHEAG